MPLDTAEVAAFDSLKVKEEMGGRMDELASLREKHGGSLAKATGGDLERVKEINAELNVLGERLDEARVAEGADDNFVKLEEYLRSPDPDGGHPGHGVKNLRDKIRASSRDIGGLFLESEAWKSFAESRQVTGKTVTLPIESLWKGYKGIGEVPGDGRMQATLFQSTDYPIQPEFLAQPIETLYQANNIGPLFAQGTTGANAIRYVTETVTATGAAETAEAGTKPEAQLSFAPTDEPVRKIAVLLPLTDESLDDVPLLRAYINARLRLFVQMREDAQLLNGNGTAPNLKGILNRSGINTATSYSIGGTNPDQALIDGVFHAAMRVRDAFLEPDNVVMKPSTWEIAALAKDANRNYLLGGPGMAGFVGQDPFSAPRLWGLRVVLNANMPAQVATNKVALVGAFAAGGMLVRRSGIDIAISDSHSTFFAENKVAIRAEERIALAVFRPAAFATVTSAA